MYKYIAHISDAHVGQPTGSWSTIRRLAGRYDPEYAERLRAICRAIDDRPERILTVHTGDLVDRGKAEEYEAATLSKDSEMVPGNHCLTSTVGQGVLYSRGARRRYNEKHLEVCVSAPEFPQVLEFQGWRLLLLDSSAPGEKGTAFARGRIGTEQIAFVASQLSRPVPTWIALHHHPKPVDPTLEISDAEDLMAVADREHVHFLYGHRHRPGTYRAEGGARLYASGQSTEEMRYRLIDPRSGEWEWVDVEG